MPIHYEEKEQIALIEWSRFVKVPDTNCVVSDLLFAIPNGAYLAGNVGQRANQMRRLKRAGLKTGVSDLFFSCPRGGYSGLYIEMKKPRDKFSGPAAIRNALSDDQRKWQVLMLEMGYNAVTCYGFDEAKKVLTNYLQLPKVTCKECFNA